jgi:hypothetical protein
MNRFQTDGLGCGTPAILSDNLVCFPDRREQPVVPTDYEDLSSLIRDALCVTRAESSVYCDNEFHYYDGERGTYYAGGVADGGTSGRGAGKWEDDVLYFHSREIFLG